MLRAFGRVKGFPLPKTSDEWSQLYERHCIILPQVSKISIEYSRKGSGQAGIRHFKYHKVEPIKHWNPSIRVEVKKESQKPLRPLVTIDYVNGDQKSIEASGLKEEQILRKILENVPKSSSSERALQSNHFSHW